jgi:hypothetical protein
MTYGARMARKLIGLFDGIKLPATDLKGIQADVTFFVASGGCVFVTVNGRTRYALVPAEVGEKYLTEKTSGPTASAPRANAWEAEFDPPPGRVALDAS